MSSDPDADFMARARIKPAPTNLEAESLLWAIKTVEENVVPRLMWLAERIECGDSAFIDMGEAVTLLTYLKTWGQVQINDE